MIKAAFFDFDGTTYQHSIHNIPESTRYTLNKLKEKGLKMILITGRNEIELSHTPQFIREFPFDAYIFDGGAKIHISDEKEEILALDKKDFRNILKYSEKHHLPLRYSTGKSGYFHELVPQKIKDIFFSLYLIVPETKKYENEDVLSGFIFTENDEQKNEIVQLVDKTNLLDIKDALEFFHIQTGKQYALLKVCDYFKLNVSETICFGDGFNDIEMLKSAGIGVAMGNAHELVKQHSDIITKSVDDNGIYEACLNLKLIEERKIENEIK